MLFLRHNEWVKMKWLEKSDRLGFQSHRDIADAFPSFHSTDIKLGIYVLHKCHVSSYFNLFSLLVIMASNEWMEAEWIIDLSTLLYSMTLNRLCQLTRGWYRCLPFSLICAFVLYVESHFEYPLRILVRTKDDHLEMKQIREQSEQARPWISRSAWG